MARRRLTPEQVINRLREAEVALSEGSTVAKDSRRIGVNPADLLPVANRVRGPQDRPGQTRKAGGAGVQPPEERCGRPGTGQPDTMGGGVGKLLIPTRRRRYVGHGNGALGVSERRACRVLGVLPFYAALTVGDAKLLSVEVMELASRFGRYGYLRITSLLKHRGLDVNHKRVQRLWRRGAVEAAQERTALAQWRVLCESAAGVEDQRVGIRLRAYQDPRR